MAPPSQLTNRSVIAWPTLLVVCTFQPTALAAEAAVQATLESPFVQRMLAMPIAEDDVFFIDDTIRYLGLESESDLLRRYVKRVELTKKVHGIEIDRTVTARQAIEKERYNSLDTLAQLRAKYYEKVIDVSPIPRGEVPWEAERSNSYKQVAPALWIYAPSENPGARSAFFFGMKMLMRERLGEGDILPQPEITIVMNDGRKLELQCNMSLYDLTRKGVVLDWCSNKSRQWFDESMAVLANDLAAGEGHLEVGFVPSARDERTLWLKNASRVPIDFRAFEAIKNSSCTERRDCIAHFVRSTGESQHFWLVSIGFVLGAVLAASLRIFRMSTLKILGIVVILVLSSAVIAATLALGANSLLLFFVPFAFGWGGLGAVGAGLLVCSLIKRRPKP